MESVHVCLCFEREGKRARAQGREQRAEDRGERGVGRGEKAVSRGERVAGRGERYQKRGCFVSTLLGITLGTYCSVLLVSNAGQ